MGMSAFRASLFGALVFVLSLSNNAWANDYREKGKPAQIAGSGLTVTPPRDWNRLKIKAGKFAETWTLDGEQLNDVTFFGGVVSGQPLVRERDKKREPLPKFSDTMLLIEVPELVQGTYRAYKQISKFEVTGTTPGQFLGKSGVHFTYAYLDADDLPRKGEGRAVIVNKKLYMVTFDAPRLHYFDRTVDDFRALAEAAHLR